MKKILGLLLFLSVGFSQITDKNFKSEINGGVTLAVFESEWQEQPFDKDIISGVKGYEDCEIIYVKSEDAPKVTKKLRLRNFPSMVLFYDGSKKETWKADMDGELDCDNKDIKNAISDIISGDVF
tara:strand:- start:150 stop:524 length:375 start_codon:yes stop_codon:yes gene_type:complete